MEENTRLNKAIASAGVCSRRAADELIFSGNVRVNGIVADNPGIRVSQTDKITVRGKEINWGHSGNSFCYLMLHKPIYVISTASDPEGRETVLDLVPKKWKKYRLYPVGRLDYFSEGLILLTNDGKLTNRLTHPRWHLPKVYQVLVREPEDALGLNRALEQMRKGMVLSEGDSIAPVQVRIIAEMSRGIVLEMVLTQGVNRQIRRMCRDTGLTILRLMRIKEGPLSLGELPRGEVRELTAAEIASLYHSVGLDFS